MKLLLHIGTEKTGSSFLQTNFAANRELLKQNDIHYPTAGKREKDMLEGRISPGNAQALTDFLNKSAFDKAIAYLEKLKKEAEDHGCSKLLLSNELLVNALGNKESIKRFLVILKEVEIGNVSMLLFIRDPVDQALSLFRHRAKSGNVPEIENWVQDKYHLPGVINQFLEGIKAERVHCFFRKYKKESDYLLKASFLEWLNIEPPKIPENQTINPSLSLSELFWLKRLTNGDYVLPGEFYNRMLNIPQDQKADDHRMKDYYRQILNKYLIHYQEVWEKINYCLDASEQLALPEKVENASGQIPIEKILDFSEVQADAITALMRDCLKPAFQVKLGAKRVKKQLGKLRKELRNISLR